MTTAHSVSTDEVHIRDLAGDVAFGHCLNRVSGTMKNGKSGGTWMRVTVCYRKIEGDWKVAHEHVSVPFDPASGKAMVELAP